MTLTELAERVRLTRTAICHELDGHPGGLLAYKADEDREANSLDSFAGFPRGPPRPAGLVPGPVIRPRQLVKAIRPS